MKTTGCSFDGSLSFKMWLLLNKIDAIYPQSSDSVNVNQDSAVKTPCVYILHIFGNIYSTQY